MARRRERRSQSEPGRIVAVSRSSTHTVSKANTDQLRLIAGLGVEGDAHAGRRVQHLFCVAVDPDRPNLRQVHLIHAELHDELAASGFRVSPGQMGENVTTRGIDLLSLPTGSHLRLGNEAVVEITGLRNPCVQLDGIQPGLMSATLDRDADGGLIRKAGIMAVVLSEGVIRPGDPIETRLPDPPWKPLEPV